jgi:hypothetical protein
VVSYDKQMSVRLKHHFMSPLPGVVGESRLPSAEVADVALAKPTVMSRSTTIRAAILDPHHR